MREFLSGFAVLLLIGAGATAIAALAMGALYVWSLEDAPLFAKMVLTAGVTGVTAVIVGCFSELF